MFICLSSSCAGSCTPGEPPPPPAPARGFRPCWGNLPWLPSWVCWKPSPPVVGSVRSRASFLPAFVLIPAHANLPMKRAPRWSLEPITEKEGAGERDFMVLNIPFRNTKKEALFEMEKDLLSIPARSRDALMSFPAKCRIRESVCARGWGINN